MITSFFSTACQKTIMSNTSEFKCRRESCGKKHMPNSNSPENSNKVNTVQTPSQQNSINTDENPEMLLVVNKIKSTSSENPPVFLEVLWLKILHRKKSVTANALFDSGLDSTLFAQNVGSYLNLNGKEQTITFFSLQLVKSRKSFQNCSTFLCRQSFIIWELNSKIFGQSMNSQWTNSI